MSNEWIWLSPPHMSGRELNYIREAFTDNQVAPVGRHIDRFEQELAEYTGIAHAAALSSGTAALHLALILCGVEEGDDVLCPSFTFAATANPIRYQKATPVFVDSENETWNMSPEWLEFAIQDRINKGGRPKAVIPVHSFGVPAKMKEITDIARRYELTVIEDAAGAMGSFYHEKHTGSFGDFTVLSFNGNKIITTSGGGALLSDDESKIEQARYLATQARDPVPYYRHSEIGYNYRMSNVLAGVGRGQLEVIDERINQRREHFKQYRLNLESLPGISFPDEPEAAFCNRWLTTMLVNPENSGGVTREETRLKLDSEKIEARPFWNPLHLQPVFRSFPWYGDGVCETLYEQGLCLPSGSGMPEPDRNRVISSIQEAFWK